MHDFSARKNRRASIIVFATIAVAACIGARAIAESLGPPQTSREVVFTYHTDVTESIRKRIGLKSGFRCPRNDKFQDVTLVSIDSPMHAEVIEQPSHGNRVAHFSATARCRLRSR